MQKVLRKIPFFSQLSRHEWKERGFKDAEDAKYWENRSCGIACMKMILDMHEDHKGQRFADLIREMEGKGVYKDGVGCVHQGIVDELNNRNIDSQRMQVSEIRQISESIDQGNILIVSIGTGLAGGKKNGHLVLVIGYVEHAGEVLSVILNHTSSRDDRQWPEKEIGVNRFMEHFSGNAIRVGLKSKIIR